ncbi:hypothetical protein [Oceanobacillus massiliensis]|uniref:hypothetical protein n=1 Tax=Oceanobacillus massiliensis TaxID=1465765 RepID=UPI0002899030|nr:hypothetical protein [Oceanobacillus massiliensis]
MADKKQYFVAVDSKEIREISIDDNQVEYEIEAEESELLEIEELFKTMEGESKEAILDFHFRPFDEDKVDSEREVYHDSLIKIYQKIYELGTPDTKKKIDELGII